LNRGAHALMNDLYKERGEHDMPIVLVLGSVMKWVSVQRARRLELEHRPG
jgi:hypothetical protein